MILCLDIGNTHIFGGIFKGQDLLLSFRYPSKSVCTSDQFGLFLKAFLREHDIPSSLIQAVSMGSVVPSLDYSISSACMKYFNLNPIMLKPGVKTGLNLSVKTPTAIGADRISNAVAAVQMFPNQDLILIDFGTATTICAVSSEKDYLGGAIYPGIKTTMEALCSFTAKLVPVEILHPGHALGKTTEHNIQSGLYYTQLGAARELISRITKEAKFRSEVKVVGTGGYAHLFENEHLYSVNVPNLVLHGLRIIYEKNC
jgi:type III pantothenate kinase